jgi:Fe2+ transport system protein FeoA
VKSFACFGGVGKGDTFTAVDFGGGKTWLGGGALRRLLDVGLLEGGSGVSLEEDESGVGDLGGGDTFTGEGLGGGGAWFARGAVRRLLDVGLLEGAPGCQSRKMILELGTRAVAILSVAKAAGEPRMRVVSCPKTFVRG